MLYSFTLYRKNWQNFIEILLLISCIAYCLLLILDFTKNFTEMEEVSRTHVAAVALFLSWGNLTLILGKAPGAGIYILMITGVIGELLKFLTLYATCLIGFAMAFHILGGKSHPKFFENPLTSIITILVMMVGEINYADLFDDKVCNLEFNFQKLINYNFKL